MTLMTGQGDKDKKKKKTVIVTIAHNVQGSRGKHKHVKERLKDI